LAILIGAALVLSACSEDTSEPNETLAVETTVQQPGTTFVSPQPPDEFASGLTIGFIPDGYFFVWNEGHESATFHVFQTEDGSDQVSVGVQESPQSSGVGEAMTYDGRQFVVYEEGSQIRVTEEVGNDIRVDVLSGSLDEETLLQIAASTIFDPGVPTGGMVVPPCDDTAACASGFLLDDGVFYAVGCTAIRDAAVSDEVIGSGEFEGEMVTVNVLHDVSRDVMVAISLPGGLCNEGDEAVSQWSMVFPTGGDQDAVTQAICEVGELSAAERQANGC
jgi:hypothetical protein